MTKNTKDTIRKIILIVAITVFTISLINVYTGLKQYSKNNKLYNDIECLNPFNSNDLSLAYTKLKELNEDYVGWLYIPGTKINYPVVKGPDNSFYLNHNFLKEESKAGSIFIDCNINEFEDKNTIIYGHYMKDGSMFADLHKISSELNSSYKIYIAIGGTILEYEIFSIFRDEANIENYETIWSTSADYLTFLNRIRDKSSVEYNNKIYEYDKILTLSTCDFNYKNGRLILYLNLI